MYMGRKPSNQLSEPTQSPKQLQLTNQIPPTNWQVVVVLSGSMEPGFQRGDILFLNMGTAPVRTGEIVVFNIDGRDIPIVHRVIKVRVDCGIKVWPRCVCEIKV